MSHLEVALTFLKLALVIVAPGFLFTLGVFPRMPVTQRVAVGAAVGIGLPALVETLVGHYRGVLLTPTLAMGLTLATGAVGLLALPRWRHWRAWVSPHPDTRRWLPLVLLGLVLLGALLAYKPHLDYALPIHRDEWTHYDASAAIERSGGNVSQGMVVTGFHGFDRNPEAGFHVALVHAKQVAAVGWEPLLLAWPALVFALLLVALFAACAPFGYGPEAVVMGLALPTSLRVLGPQYAVPLALGLFLIPVAYILFLRPERVRAYALLAPLMLFVYVAHPPSALAVAFLMLGYSATHVRREWRMALALLPLAAAPFVLAKLEAPERYIAPEVLLSQEITLPIPSFLALFGAVNIALFALGTFVALRRLHPERLGWLATSVAHLAIIFVYLRYSAGVGILYDRAWMHGLLTMSVTAASGLAVLRLGAATALVPPGAVRGRTAVPWLLAVLVLAPAVLAQDAREDEYYRLVTEREYEDMLWIRDHVTLMNGTRVAIDAHQGTALSAVTGLVPLSKSFAYAPPRGLENFLANGSADKTFVERHQIGLVYTHRPFYNDDFDVVRPSVYVRRA